MKVFLTLHASTCCWGIPKPKYEPFITHNKGTLIDINSYNLMDQKSINTYKKHSNGTKTNPKKHIM